MGTIFSKKFASVDFESLNSLDGSNDVAIQIGITIMDDWELENCKTFMSYIKPTVSVDWHGERERSSIVFNKEVRLKLKKTISEAPMFFDLWGEIKEMLTGRVIVSHANGTEKKFLRVFPFHKFDEWVDTLKVTRAIYTGLESYRLGNIIEETFGDFEYKHLERLCPNLEWHDALYDSVATLILLRKIVFENEIKNYPLRVLQDF